MMRNSSLCVGGLLLVVCVSAACGSTSGTTDSGSGGGHDSGTVTDTGSGGSTDAGTVTDTGSGGGTDAGGTADTGSGGSTDAGGTAFMSLAPCTNASDYVSGMTTIAFGGTLGTAYSPRCLTVAAGTAVTFTGDFTMHPLAPSNRGTAGNPIPATSTGTSASATFGTPGFYPYFCQIHGSNDGTGMSGVVQVQ